MNEVKTQVLSSYPPRAGRPEGVATRGAKPRRGSPLYKKLLFFAGVAVLSASAFAAEIAFTGGEDGTSRDLSLAANWAGGALPGADDVGTVDVSTFGAAYTVGDGAAIGGIRFDNGTTAVTLSGAGVLTLGAGGLNASGAGDVALKSPLAVSAEATWAFAGGYVYLDATIAGSSKLTLKGATKGFVFRRPPAYGGDMVITSAPSYFLEQGRWAQNVTADTKVYFMMTGNTEVAMSTLCPGTFSCSAWDPNTVWTRRDGIASPYTYGYFRLDRGTFNPGGVGLKLVAGKMTQTGGAFTTLGSENYSGLNVGGLDYYITTSSPGWGSLAPAEYHLQGGTFDTRVVHVGYYSKSLAAPQLFEQTGGTLKTGELGIGYGNQSTEGTFAQFTMGGGTLDVGNTYTGRSRALSLVSPTGQDSKQVAYYCQTGGVVTARQVQWGNSFSKQSIGQGGYGLFELLGGDFTLGSGGFATAAGYWNASSARAGYRAFLKGGTLTALGTQSNALALDLPASGRPFAFKTDGSFTQNAPIAGDGELHKTGTGELVLRDATRFTGALSVDEGTVAVFGSGSSVADPTDGAIVWTADAAVAAAKEAGYTRVTNFVSTSGAYTFSRFEPPSGSTFGDVRAPEYTEADGSFNGHASLYFNACGLRLPAAENPLSGTTNFTVAIVFRMNQNNIVVCEPPDRIYTWAYAPCLLGNRSSMVMTATANRPNDGVPSLTGVSRVALGYRPKANVDALAFSHGGYEINDNTAKVAIFTFCNHKVTVAVDGYEESYAYDGTDGAKYFKDMSLVLGCGSDTAALTHDNQFQYFRLAELRIYPDKTLDADARARLGYLLATKYGLNQAGTDRFALTACPYVTAAAATDSVTPEYAWDADSLTDVAAGDEVTVWTSSGSAATPLEARRDQAAGRTVNAPTLTKPVYNGHAAVRFVGTNRTGLAVAASPLKGLSSWSAAVVFATDCPTSEGNGTMGGNLKGSGEGIFGSRAYEKETQCWGFSWHKYGTVMAVWQKQTACFHRNPFLLNDGRPHVVVLTADATAGVYRYLVDGRVVKSDAYTGVAQAVDRLFFGYLHDKTGQMEGYSDMTGYFTGDIAAARIYTRALSEEECLLVCDYYIDRYAILREHNLPYGVADLTAFGLGATNVNVAAGATLKLNRSASAPYTLGAGQSLTGAGSVDGAVCFGTGSVYDLSATRPTITDLRLNGCTVRIGGLADLPADGSAVATFSGAIQIDAGGLAEVQTPSWITVFENVAPEQVASGTTFAVRGIEGATAEYDAVRHAVRIHRPSGLVIFVR